MLIFKSLSIVLRKFDLREYRKVSSYDWSSYWRNQWQVSPEYLSGKFVYGVFSGKDTSFVAPSLLGQYHCYFSHIESYDICSNNPYLCQSYLLDNNGVWEGGGRAVSNRCNLNSMIWLTYVGATYDLTTSLNNVYRFPVNAVYSYSDKACFSCLQENYFRHIFSEEYTAAIGQ